MPQGTGIEWTDATWNPVTGCTRVSPGCANCYIERQVPMRVAGRVFARVGNEETTGVRLHPERLEARRIPKGPRVFVCSMSDLFHDEVGFGFLVRVFSVMRSTPDRTFQVLTKRPERMAQFLGLWRATHPEPEPNVWLGVSVENARFSWRADLLRELPAAVRFVSAEPLLGSLYADASRLKRRADREASNVVMQGFIEDGMVPDDASSYLHRVEAKLPNRTTRPLDLTGIDWLIAGGESGGITSRPMHPAWARELRDACAEAGTAFFFKQWGSWAPASIGNVDGARAHRFLQPDGEERTRSTLDQHDLLTEQLVYVGRSPKAGGKHLDGRQWCEFPRDAVLA